MNLQHINQWINGVIIGGDIHFEGVSIDSRTIQNNQLFVAIEGEQFDGHDYIEKALMQGARAFLVSDHQAIPEGAHGIVVEDTLQALKQWATGHRAQFKLPCIGVTGSCGKTTVRSMVAHICRLAGKTLSPQKNFNNHIGLPLTLLELDASYDYAVLELGASGLHEIAYLSEIAKPTISTVTNVHPAHLEGFGSLQGIVDTKGEIYAGLDHDGVAILNLDSPYAQQWSDTIGDRACVTLSTSQAADIEIVSKSQTQKGIKLQVKTPKGQIEIILPGLGDHTIENALCAIALLEPLPISLSTIKQGLETFEGVEGRMKQTQLSEDTMLVDDTYNANPGSMKAAINYLKSCKGQRILVIGDMAELGESAKEWHQKLGTLAKDDGIDTLYATGPLSRFTVEAFGKKAQWFENKDEIVHALANSTGATILVKGSRSAKMESVVTDLINKGSKSA